MNDSLFSSNISHLLVTQVSGRLWCDWVGVHHQQGEATALLSGNPTKSACSRDAPLREIKVLLLEQGVVIGDGSGETDVQTAL